MKNRKRQMLLEPRRPRRGESGFRPRRQVRATMLLVHRTQRICQIHQTMPHPPPGREVILQIPNEKSSEPNISRALTSSLPLEKSWSSLEQRPFPKWSQSHPGDGFQSLGHEIHLRFFFWARCDVPIKGRDDSGGFPQRHEFLFTTSDLHVPYGNESLGSVLFG